MTTVWTSCGTGADHVGEVAGDHDRVHRVGGLEQPVVVRQPVVEVGDHQDPHVRILPYLSEVSRTGLTNSRNVELGGQLVVSAGT